MSRRPATVIIPVRSVEELDGSYRVTRSDTGAVLYLSKRAWVQMFPGRVVIPDWYAKKIQFKS